MWEHGGSRRIVKSQSLMPHSGGFKEECCGSGGKACLSCQSVAQETKAVRYFECGIQPRAGMAELADAADSKSAGPCGHGGSTPPPGTRMFRINNLQLRPRPYRHIVSGATKRRPSAQSAYAHFYTCRNAPAGQPIALPSAVSTAHRSHTNGYRLPCGLHTLCAQEENPCSSPIANHSIHNG